MRKCWRGLAEIDSSIALAIGPSAELPLIVARGTLTHTSPVRVLDGAMGTELLRRGHDLTKPLWSARPLLSQPQVITAIHAEYIAQGADIITTNTFRTNPRTFVAAGLSEAQARAATELAVRAARQAARFPAGRPIRIAGSMAPVEDCYHPDRVPARELLLAEHRMLAGWLAEAGIDLVIAETMNTIREAQAAVQAARENGMETWASFICQGPPLGLLSGEPLEEAVAAVVELNATAVGVNCVPVSLALECIQRIRSITDVDVLVYANGGVLTPAGQWRFDERLTPQRYGAYCQQWLMAGASILGGCCGTGPAHTGAVRNTVDNWHRPA